MEKKDIDWSNIGFGYYQTDERYVSNFKNGAWDDGVMTKDANVVMNECAGVLQYAQTCFEGLKAYTTEHGKDCYVPPDLNASRMANTAKRLEMPPFPEDRFVEAVEKVVAANAAYVPPYGFWCYLIYSSVHVCEQFGNWCKTGRGISVPYVLYTGRSLL